MDVSTQMPLDNPQQVSQWLQSALPGYTYAVRGKFVVVGAGAATGVLIRPEGPGRAKLMWAFPNLGVQVVLTLAIVLSGILPGLILFGIVWLAVSSDVGRIKQELARALAGQPAMGGAMAPVVAPSSGGGARALGVALVGLALMSGAYSAYAYSRYQSYAYSSYGGYGSYGRYGGYGSSLSSIFRRRWEERMQVSGAVAAASLLVGVILVAAGGKRPAPTMGGYPMQQGGYPMQQGGYPMQQGGYPMQQGGYPMQQGGYPQQPGAFGQPSQPGGFAPQQPNPFTQPSQPGAYGQAQPVSFGQPAQPGAPQPGGWPGAPGTPGNTSSQ